MKSKLNIGLLLAVFIFASAATKPKVYYKSGTFKISGATSQTIYPGVQGAPITNKYTISLTLKKARTLVIDSAWVDGVAVACLLLPENNSTEMKFEKGNRFTLFVETIKGTNDSQPLPEGVVLEGPKMANPPAKHTGKLLFRYKMFDQIYYFSVKNFKVVDNVYAP